MKEFPNGVSYYTMATLKVGFPEEQVCCKWCPMLDSERGTNRPICRRTHEYLIDPETTIGEECQLDIER